MGQLSEYLYILRPEILKYAVKETSLNPKVSIIVPAYNAQWLIEKCLMSLIQQTLKEIEIIVIDDGSTDYTYSVACAFKEDSRIKVIRQLHKKQNAARNYGMEFATGEYIGFVDADDWVDLDYFEKLYNAAKKYNSDVALATNIRIKNNKTKKCLSIKREEFVTSLQERIDISNQAKNPCLTNKIYRREMLLKNQITWDEDGYCEDELFTIQAVYYANGLVTVPKVNYYYFRNPLSKVNSNAEKLNKEKNSDSFAVLNFLKSKNADIRDKDFWATKKEYRILNIPFLTVKKSLCTEKVLLLGIKLFEKTSSEKYDYKRARIKFLGISFTYKTKEWLINANNDNLEKNKINLIQPVGNGDKNILFIASNFVKAGGIETRLLQYIKQISSFGWNCYILSENNENEALKNLTNFSLNFDATNFDKCLNEIIERFNINVIEFQFKNPKILKNIDLDKLKTKARLGCIIHNLGITDYKSVNKLDYKIMVSKFMYENHYTRIKNADVIQNCIDTSLYQNKPTWTYKGQETAVLITRIDTDKMKSIECFIKYCKKNNIKFLIAGGENTSKLLKKKLINKYALKEETFIGNVDTMEYLSENTDNILFVAGVGMVILEALYLNYPCFCCSEFNWKNYSFVTYNNIMLFDNFTIRKNSLVSQKKKKEFIIDKNNINKYQQKHYIINNRNLRVCAKKYMNIIEGKSGE